MSKIDTSQQAYLRALADYILSIKEVKYCMREMILKVYVRNEEDSSFEMAHPDLIHHYLKSFPDYTEWKQNLMNIHTLSKVGKIIGNAEMFKK